MMHYRRNDKISAERVWNAAFQSVSGALDELGDRYERFGDTRKAECVSLLREAVQILDPAPLPKIVPKIVRRVDPGRPMAPEDRLMAPEDIPPSLKVRGRKSPYTCMRQVVLLLEVHRQHLIEISPGDVALAPLGIALEMLAQSQTAKKDLRQAVGARVQAQPMGEA